MGKRDFGEISTNEVVANKVAAPGGVIVDRSTSPGKAYVWDSQNSRILGIDLAKCYSQPSGLGSANDQANIRCSADLVIGQPSLSDYGACNQDASYSNYPNRLPASASTLCGMAEDIHTTLEDKTFTQMFVDSQSNLYVPDIMNHRVLKYINPFTTDTAADEVWGQNNFSGNQCNKTGGIRDEKRSTPTDSSLCFISDNPMGHGGGVSFDTNGNLWVADSGNHRVLRFPKVGDQISKTADLVLGQPSFTTRQPGSNMNQLHSPTSLRFDSAGNLYVAEKASPEQFASQTRILIFQPPFTTNMEAAKIFLSGSKDFWLGEFISNGLWIYNDDGWKLQLWDLAGTTKIREITIGHSGGGGLGIDSNNGLLAAWYGNGNDVTYFSANNNYAGKGAYRGIYTFPNKWFFSPPLERNQISARRLIHSAWTGVAVAGNQLIVSDSRLLFWNLGSNYDLSVLSNGKTPDGYVGASSFTNVPNPQYSQLKSDASNRVWAAKTDSIVVYQAPLTTGTSPIKTITSPLNVLGGGQVTFDSTKGVWGLAPTTDGQFLWVSQPYKHRVFRVRNPLSDNPMVDVILGQIEVNGIYCNRNPNDPANTNAWAVPNPSFVSANTLCYPGAISLDKQNNLYVSDHYIEIAGNKRLLMFSANNFLANNSSVTFAPNASKEFSGSATFEPAFDSTNRMVIGFNPYTNNRFLQYFNPSNTTFVPDGRLEDFYNWPVALTFDYYDNLYAYDANRGQVRIYKNPFNNPSPPPMPISKLSPCPPIGDVDNDGYVTNIDALAVLKIVAKLDPYKNPTEDQLRRANVDTRNNNVTSVDSLIIKRYLGGLETTFRACAQPPPTPNPTTTPSPSPSPNASRLTVNTTCSGLDTSYPSNHVDLTITGTVIPPTNNTTNGVWMTVTDQSSNNTAFTTYYGSLGQFSVNSSYHDSIINIRGTSLKLMGDGRNYLIGAYMGPYTYNIPTLTNPFYQTNFSVTCPFASPSPSTGRYPIN